MIQYTITNAVFLLTLYFFFKTRQNNGNRIWSWQMQFLRVYYFLSSHLYSSLFPIWLLMYACVIQILNSKCSDLSVTLHRAKTWDEYAQLEVSRRIRSIKLNWKKKKKTSNEVYWRHCPLIALIWQLFSIENQKLYCTADIQLRFTSKVYQSNCPVRVSMREGLPSFEHSAQDNFDPARTANSFDPPMGPLSFDVLRLIFCPTFDCAHLLIVPELLLENTGSLFFGVQGSLQDSFLLSSSPWQNQGTDRA